MSFARNADDTPGAAGKHFAVSGGQSATGVSLHSEKAVSHAQLPVCDDRPGPKLKACLRLVLRSTKETSSLLAQPTPTAGRRPQLTTLGFAVRLRSVTEPREDSQTFQEGRIDSRFFRSVAFS